jgi:hypothetical protein
MAVETQEVTSSLTTKFGAAMAIGDILPFGRQLVVGAPGGNGRVIVMTASGTVSVQTTLTLTDATSEAGDEFGAAIAIGDVDRASTSDDLVIGVPGEDNDAGAVIVLRGGTAGLPTRSTIVQSIALFGDRDAGDRFGATFAIGSFNGPDNRPSNAHTGIDRLDLVIGAPGEKPDLGIGSEQAVTAGAFELHRGGLGLVTPMLVRHQEVAGRASDP